MGRRGGAIAVVFFASAASAQPSSTRPLTEALTITGDTTCLERIELATAVARWLKRDAIDARVSIAVSASDPPAPTLSFSVSREGDVIAVRTFERIPAVCKDLRSATAIAIALAIDATILSAPPDPPPKPSRSVPEPPRSDPPPDVAKPPAVGGSAQPAVDAEVLVLAGILPTATVGARVGAALDLFDRFSLTGGVLGTLPSRSDVGPGEVDARLVAGDLAACWIALRGSFGLRVCAGGAAGGVSAKGRGFGPSLSTFLPWVAAVGRVGLRQRVWRSLALQAAVSGVVPFIRPDLQVAAPGGTTIVSSRSLPSAGIVGDFGWVVSF